MFEKRRTEALKTLVITRDPMIVHTLSVLKASGFRIPEEGKSAREWCEQQAHSGDADAQLAFAQFLDYGIFGPRDSKASVEWIRRAASQLHPAAMMAYSPHVELGIGSGEPDPSRAVSLMRDSAGRGYASAWTVLASWYELGPQLEVDKGKARDCYRKAAALGCPIAQQIVGNELLHSDDYAEKLEGLAYLEISASQGLKAAHEVLGAEFLSGEHGLPVNAAIARFHQESAERIEKEASEIFSDDSSTQKKILN